MAYGISQYNVSICVLNIASVTKQPVSRLNDNVPPL